MNEYLTVREIAEIYKVNIKTVYGWIEQRLFPTVKLNNFLVRIEKEGFEKWLEKREAR